MATTNDVTGDKLVSKRSTDKFRDNYDMIFGKKAKADAKKVAALVEKKK